MNRPQEMEMKHATSARLLLVLGAALACGAVLAQQPAAAGKQVPRSAAEETHRKDDIAKHRQMARAHEEAARCLESGEKEAVCQERLREACKGIAVGRVCGLRHGH
jgi:hypothetical protein